MKNILISNKTKNQGSSAKQKVLIIEDDPFLVDIYTTKLKDLGFSIDVANDGKDGLRKLKEGNFDLLMLDIVLPHIDGWQVLKQINESEEFKNLKVIVLSNLGQKEEVEKGLKLGAIKYLIKAHYTPQEVIEEIKKVLK
ncbi:MAG: response regulator [Patescibacteria group bacterium]|nr:response regulator [Patescibacteria group bacterium]